MKTIAILSTVLLVVGGLNWGLWGLFQFDLVAALLGGNDAAAARVVYTLVGLSAIALVASVPALVKKNGVSA